MPGSAQVSNKSVSQSTKRCRGPSWLRQCCLSTNLVLQEGAKVEHLLSKAVQRLRDARLEIAKALIRCRHVLVVCREVCRELNSKGASSPSTRFLFLDTRRSICPRPSSNRSSPALISTKRASGFLTPLNTLTSVSDNESMRELCDSGGGFARCLCFATFCCQIGSPNVLRTSR